MHLAAGGHARNNLSNVLNGRHLGVANGIRCTAASCVAG